jgi:hypothetical protein
MVRSVIASAMGSADLPLMSEIGSAQASQGIGFTALGAAIVSSAVIFSVQLLAFIVLKDQIVRVLYVSRANRPQ